MWCTWTGSMANNVQVITVNGEQITGKTVKSMTFDAAENVTLLFSDDTSESIPAQQPEYPWHRRGRKGGGV